MLKPTARQALPARTITATLPNHNRNPNSNLNPNPNSSPNINPDIKNGRGEIENRPRKNGRTWSSSSRDKFGTGAFAAAATLRRFSARGAPPPSPSPSLRAPRAEGAPSMTACPPSDSFPLLCFLSEISFARASWRIFTTIPCHMYVRARGPCIYSGNSGERREALEGGGLGEVVAHGMDRTFTTKNTRKPLGEVKYWSNKKNTQDDHLYIYRILGPS